VSGAYDTPTVCGSRSCRICGNLIVRTLSVREMMYGLREQFEYFECDACGCVQIATYPQDIARHYPDNYYRDIARGTKATATPGELLKDWARSQLLQFPTFRDRWFRTPSTEAWLAGKPLMRHYLDRLDTSKARILDVGCGEGLNLQHLRTIGYRNAEGVDPFIKHDLAYRGHLLVTKANLGDITGRYDCISFHHSLEHMPDQAEVLRTACQRLTPGGIMIIRIPVASGEAWRTYRENWAQLDAPRHYYLHTNRSFRLLAEQCDLVVQSIIYDSDGFQFWGSELYRRDIPLLDPRSPRMGSHEIFSAAELDEFDRRATLLNAENDGDQIVAVLAARI
jgi:SAM-dependent methyltransferase